MTTSAVEQDLDRIIDPVNDELIDERELAGQLLAQAKSQGVSLVGPDGLLASLTKTVLEAALEAAASLSTLSERGRVVPETNDPAIRETFVFRYRLMYRVEPERVLVLAFVHGARDFATWRQRRDSL